MPRWCQHFTNKCPGVVNKDIGNSRTKNEVAWSVKDWWRSGSDWGWGWESRWWVMSCGLRPLCWWRQKGLAYDWTDTNHLFISGSHEAIQVGEAYEEFFAKEPRASTSSWFGFQSAVSGSEWVMMLEVLCFWWYMDLFLHHLSVWLLQK